MNFASLKLKVALILIAVVSVYVVLGYIILHSVVNPLFSTLDEEAAISNIARVESAINSEMDTIAVVLRDWGDWDATHDFVLGNDSQYPEENFDPASLSNIDVNLILLYDINQKLVSATAFDLETKLKSDIDIEILEQISNSPRLFDLSTIDTLNLGVMRGKNWPILIGSNNVTDGFGNEPVGTIVLGRYLTPARVATLEQKTDVDFSARLLSDTQPLSESQPAEVFANKTIGASSLVRNGEMLIAKKMLRNLMGESVGYLEVRTPSKVSTAGASSVKIAIVLLVLSGLLITGIMWLLLHRFITTPVATLAAHIQRIRKDGNLANRINFTRNDEIGTLGRQFDSLTGELERARWEMAEARDSALDSSRLKSEFLATMSHEIRTPMNGVMGMAELLLQTELCDKQRNFARTIQRSADALLSIINDVLDFSKIESGKFHLESTDLDLREIIEDLGEVFAERAQRKNIELLCTTNPPYMHTTYNGDAGRIRQVLVNLIGNAIKFTDSGEVLVITRVLDENEDSAKIYIEVSDTGIGLEAGAKNKIFDSFVQADGSTTRRYGGTGLGLAICKSLVELMGGEIGVASTPGHGSTFWFSLTLKKTTAKDCHLKINSDHLKDLHILVVDDNATNREILKHQLIAWEITGTCAKNATEALDILNSSAAQQPFDLAILDMNMPDMDGLELAERIKSDSRFTDLPLVMLSSVCQGSIENENYAANLSHFLTKPTKQSVLFDTIADALTAQNDRMESRQETKPETRSNINHPNFSGARILLAEDNSVNSQVAMGMLGLLNCEVDSVANGKQAVSRVRKGHYDLVLMDCQMPIMDGFEATAAIRRLEQHTGNRTPIIAVTANAMAGDRKLCIEAGMDDYMRKPFSIESMREMILKWVPESKLESRSVAPLQPADQTREVVPATPLIPPGRKAVLNPMALQSIRKLQRPGQPDLLNEIVTIYLDSTEEHIRALHNAVINKDPKSLKFGAHSLKSSSANLGAENLAGLCTELERKAGIDEMENIGKLVAKIDQESCLVIEALDQELGVTAA